MFASMQEELHIYSSPPWKAKCHPHSKISEQLICIYPVLLSSPEPKALVSYCHSAPSVRPSVCLSVRPSSVRKFFTFSTSSPEPLDGFWWNLVGMKYSWSLTSVVVFRPDPSRADPGQGQNRSQGVPFFKKLLLQTRRLQRQTKWIAMI